MGLPAARVSDLQTCPLVTGVAHVGGPITLGCCTVRVTGLAQVGIGDMHPCVGPPGTLALGSTTVLVGGLPASRLGGCDRPWRRRGRTWLSHRAG